VILVCYLLPPGEQFAQKGKRFAESYRDHPPGEEHVLMLVLKGGAELPSWPFIGPVWVECHSNDGLDIGSLQRVCAEHAEYEQVMWLGAHSRILDDRWLQKFHAVAKGDGIGAVAATGSFEAGVSGRQPNAHLRTSCLMIAPQLLNSLGFPPAQTRTDRYEFEHGTQSLYRRLQARGLEGLVVGRSGRAYCEHEWGTSTTFRHGDQAELLIADNHTDHFANAPPDERLALARAAGWEPE
jgi:hypothetical protein